MEVRPGYKWTEVGVIPDDWEVKNLGDIGSFRRGRNIPKTKLTTEGQPCVLYGEIYTTYDCVVHELRSRISRESALQATPIHSGDILFASSGETADEIGKCFAYTGAELAYAGGDLIVMSPARADSIFLGYQLNSPTVCDQKSKLGQGSSVVHIYADRLSTIHILIPPLPEQRAIATVLSDVDALITALDKLIAKKRAIKQAAMQQLLTGRTRLPGFSGEWEIFTIGNAFDFLPTANNPRSHLSDDGDVRYVHYGDIHTRWSSFLDCHSSALPFIAEDKVGNAPFLQDGDLIMVDASEDYEGTGKSVEVRNATGKKAVAGLHTLLLRGNKEILADGFKGYLQHIPSLRECLRRIATGISVYGISKTNLKALSLRLPPLPEQRAIAAVLSDMDAEIDAFERRCDKTRALKQGMMQELLTGRIRLRSVAPS